MAVTFRRGPNTLVKELQRRGFRVDSVYSMDGAPDRSLQICLHNGVIVNWDRDSQSVWADGPWDKSRKVEAYLQKRAEGSRRSRGRRSRGRYIFLSLAAAAIVLALVGRVYWSQIQSYLSPDSAPATVSNTANGTPVAGD
jgi:hypothetical protein